MSAENPVQDQDGGAGQGNNNPAPEVFESLEKLKETDPIEESVPSEVSHVTMIRSKSDSPSQDATWWIRQWHILQG